MCSRTGSVLRKIVFETTIWFYPRRYSAVCSSMSRIKSGRHVCVRLVSHTER